MLLAGCSVTVQPKHPVAAATSSKPTGTATTPSAPASSTPSKAAPKDVDHTVCQAVRADLSTGQQKVGGTDKASPRKMGADFKAAGDSLRSESQKTKDTELKATLTQLATDYDSLGANVAAKRPTDADLKKIAEIGPK